jgi:iron(III) transport system ATP-binding protein
MPGISIRHVTKRFGDLVAANNITLEIEKGEFFTLLGPSGCGKTTLLRCIAGFLDHEQGQVLFGDRRVDRIPTHKRGVGMVFQNYAVFPHLSVQDNVKYGLKARKVSTREQVDRARQALALVRLEGLEDRLPNQLSGGQLQRVAIARALVIEPEVLLMDEPLSNLDAKLRVEMRGEIRLLQQKMGITTIYVTHDQEEALSISDRIAVMLLPVLLEPPTCLTAKSRHPRRICPSPSAEAFPLDCCDLTVWRRVRRFKLRCDRKPLPSVTSMNQCLTIIGRWRVKLCVSNIWEA